MTRFSGRVTEEEFVAAMRLSHGTQPHGRSMLAAAGFFALLAVVIGISLGPMGSLLIVLVFVLPSLAAWWNQSATRYRRIFAKNEGLHSFVEGSFDETEFAYGVNHVIWSSVRGVVSDDSVAVVSAPHMYVVPRSFFVTDEGWTAFVERARMHVPKPPSVMSSSLKSALIWVVVLVVIFVLWSLLASGCNFQ